MATKKKPDLKTLAIRGLKIKRQMEALREELQEVTAAVRPILSEMANGKQSLAYTPQAGPQGGIVNYRAEYPLNLLTMDEQKLREILADQFDNFFDITTACAPKTRQLRTLVTDASNPVGIKMREFITIPAEPKESISWKPN